MNANGKRDFNWEAFAKRLRQRREAKGLTLRGCATELGLSHATVYRAEVGRPVQVPHYLYICEWLKVDPLTYCLRRLKK